MWPTADPARARHDHLHIPTRIAVSLLFEGAEYVGQPHHSLHLRATYAHDYHMVMIGRHDYVCHVRNAVLTSSQRHVPESDFSMQAQT
eukprot:jgi/Botrbrau1/11193/Bobra.0214s0018.1